MMANGNDLHLRFDKYIKWRVLMYERHTDVLSPPVYKDFPALKSVYLNQRMLSWKITGSWW